MLILLWMLLLVISGLIAVLVVVMLWAVTNAIRTFCGREPILMPKWLTNDWIIRHGLY